MLELDGYVEMVALRGPSLGDVAQLQARCGAPIAKQAVTRGEIWSYGPRWAAWVQAGHLHEIWVARP